MLTRNRDHTLAGGILFGPAVEIPASATGIRVRPLTNVPSRSVDVGGLMLGDNVFLRTEIDLAIRSPVDKGVIVAPPAGHSFSGVPGGE